MSLYNESGFYFSNLINDIIFCLTALYLSWLLVKPLYQQRKMSMMLQEIAGSPSKHWFYGHTQKFSGLATGFQWLVDKTTQFPVMMNFWYTPFFSILNIHHPDSVSAMLHSDAPKSRFIIDMLKPWLGNALGLSYGERWHRNRRLLTPAFHFRMLKQYIVAFNVTAKVLLKKWDKKVGNNIEISDDISLMTFDSILKCAMSLDLNIQQLRNHPYIEAISRCQDLILMRLANPFHYIEWIYNMSKNGKEFKKCIKIMHEQANEIIQVRKLKMKRDKDLKTPESNIKCDFLDILLQAEDEDGKGLNEIEILNEVDSFLFGGFDTTSSGIQWALHNLAKYPEFQKKCRHEITEVIGEKENIEWDDIKQLEYLTMFLKESLRLNPPIINLIDRRLDKSINICSALNKQKNTTLPKDSILLLSIYALHRNPHVWDNPEIFDPDRFTTEKSKNRSPYAFLPFSAGSRNCIGQNFAMNEMKIVLAQIIRRFKLSIKDDTPESKIARKITLQSETGVYVFIKNI